MGLQLPLQFPSNGTLYRPLWPEAVSEAAKGVLLDTLQNDTDYFLNKLVLSVW